jgi:hypothetical protein
MMAFGLPAMRVRADYGLRGQSRAEVERELALFFDRIDAEEAAEGDLLLLAPGPAQLHVVILTRAGYVHADASIRRVVEVPGKVPWPLLSCWRHAVGER